MVAPKSSVDDLCTGRGVVLGRAATTLRSIETQPLGLADLFMCTCFLAKKSRANSLNSLSARHPRWPRLASISHISGNCVWGVCGRVWGLVGAFVIGGSLGAWWPCALMHCGCAAPFFYAVFSFDSLSQEMNKSSQEARGGEGELLTQGCSLSPPFFTSLFLMT